MPRKAGQIVLRPIAPEIVEEQEGVVVLRGVVVQRRHRSRIRHDGKTDQRLDW